MNMMKSTLQRCRILGRKKEEEMEGQLSEDSLHIRFRLVTICTRRLEEKYRGLPQGASISAKETNEYEGYYPEIE